MEFIFVDTEEFKQAREDMKGSLKYFRQHPFKLILSTIVFYMIIVSTIILFG